MNENVENDVSKNDKFDLSLLKSFLNTDEALEEVLTIFNTQTEQDLQQIKNAIAEKNIEKTAEIAHRMLTMFRQLKANAVISILEKMEDFEEEKVEIGQMKMLVEKLIMNIRDLQKELENR